MAVPVPLDWAGNAGAYASAAMLQAGVGDPLNFLLNPPRCRAYRLTAGAALTAGVASAINLDGELYDSTNTMHSLVANLSRMQAPQDGLYHIVGQVAIGGQAATGSVAVDLKLNGTTNVVSNRNNPPPAGSTIVVVAMDLQMSFADYVELYCTPVTTASPAASSSLTFLQMRWVSN